MKKALATKVTVGVVAVGVLAGCAAPGQGVSVEHSVKSEFSQALHDRLPQEIKDAGSLKIADEPNGPWRVVEGDDIVGAQQDLLTELSTVLGVEFDTEIVGGLPAVKLGVQSGRTDVAFGPLLSNAKSQEDLIFIEYVLGRPSFVYKADAPEISSVEDICGKTMALIEGTAAFDAFLEDMETRCADGGKDPVNILKQADAESTLVAVESGRADIAGTGAHRAAFFETQSPERFKKYITTDEEATADKLGMAFDRSNSELAEVVYDAWQVVFENGSYDEIMNNYNMSEIVKSEPTITD